jgi:hypothetical protein
MAGGAIPMLATLARRRWTLAAIALGLTAFGFDSAAKRHDGLAMSAVARAAQERRVEQAHPIVAWHRGQSTLWGGLGFASVLLAMGCWVRARLAHEPGPHTPFIVVIVAYLLSCLTLI